MPSRLRAQVSAVHDATVTLTSPSSESPVEPDVLMTLARACRDREHVNTGYVDRDGNTTQRRLEPYQLVTTGRRWYLLTYDRDRQDWRSLRLDRMSDVTAMGSTFVARDAPDAAAYVRRSISSSPYRYVARVRYEAPEQAVAQHFSPASVTVEADGPNACIVTAGADDPERMVLYFATVGYDFEVLEPPEVLRAVDAVSERLRRATRP
jgi:predicted DNA-binding transcriptional regulator YafY